MSDPKLLSPEWWQNKEVSHPWCDRFCQEFYAQDPSLKDNGSVGIVFFNKQTGDIIPVGLVAVQDGHFIFQYHHSYLDNPGAPPISDTLPKRKERYVAAKGDMLPFFDNLPAEGWFGKAQGLALGDESCKREPDNHSHHMDYESLDRRYHRFMMFGRDYPGAVWTTYIRNDPHIAAGHHQNTIEAALRSRSSISGMQPKLLGVANDKGEIRPANFWETSTHIVKLPPLGSAHMPSIMEYEYMSTIATKALLPHDQAVDASLTDLHLRDGSKREVLAIKRFDRTPQGEKIHFEEINQLLGRENADRYKGAYVDVANLAREKIGHEGVKQFYARLLCQFLLGNTDNHLKNFAMFHDHGSGKWSMTPDYDLAPAVNYGRSTLALYATKHRDFNAGGVEEDSHERYSELNPRKLVNMGVDFGLSLAEIRTIVHDLVANIDKAKDVVRNDPSPRLERPAPLDESSVKWHAKHGKSTHKGVGISAKEDFCKRLDGRAHMLFGTMDKYISIQESKQSSGWSR